MKRILIVLILLTLFLPPSFAMALQQGERYEAIWSADNIDIIDNAEFVEVYKYRSGYGVNYANGEMLIPTMYYSLKVPNSRFNGFFAVSNEEGLNNYALIDTANRIIIPFEYSDFDVISTDWVVGIKLVETSENIYDYFGGSKKYIISYVDIYYLPNRTRIGRLSRNQFERAKAFGNHLVVNDRFNNLHLYDSSFNELKCPFEHIADDCEFHIDNSNNDQGTIRSRITDEIIATGYRSIRRLYNTEYYSVSAKRAGSGIINRLGNIVLPMNYDDIGSSVYGNCVTVSQDGYYGLFDLTTQSLILPCEYDKIFHDYTYGYIFNDYVCVEKNGKIGYVNIHNEITCPIQYNSAAITNLGCVSYVVSLDGIQLIAADGVVTILNQVAEIYMTPASPSGYYLFAKNHEGLWGVIDWHGEIIIDFNTNGTYQYDFINDEYMVFDDNIVYRFKK